MTLNGVLTALSLLIAAWALLPHWRRTELQLRASAIDKLALLLGGFVILYLQYYPFFAAIGLTPRLGLSRFGLTPENISFLVFLSVMILIVMRLGRPSFSQQDLTKVLALVRELLSAEKHLELLSIFERNFDMLLRICRNGWVFFKMRRRLARDIPLNFVDLVTLAYKQATRQREGKPPDDKSSWLFKFLLPLRILIVRILPLHDSKAVTARQIIDEVLSANEIVKTVSRQSPYLVLRIFDSNVASTRVLAEKYIRELLLFPRSILYSEIRANQSHQANGNYELPASNRVLSHLLSDARVALQLQAWRGPGNAMLSHLDWLARNPSEDTYNWAYDQVFEEEGRWESTLFVGVSFFDVMIRRALFQDIEWHMWLYYLPSVTRSIVRNYSQGDILTDQASELPTRYSLLLREIIDTIIGWIGCLEHLPFDQKNSILVSDHLNHENENIPKSSIIALGTCLYDILQANQIAYPVKRGIMSAVYRCYFDFRQNDKFTRYSKVLLSSVSQGGFRFDRPSSVYRAVLVETFQSYDKIAIHPDHVAEVEMAINRL
jgi:hypothetical protein